MRLTSCIYATLLALAVSSPAHAQEETAPTVAPAGIESIDQLSKATQTLYKKISASLIRVRIDQGYQSMLAPGQRKEFMDWVKAQPSDAPATQPDSTDTPNPTLREQRRAARLEKLNDVSSTQPSVVAAPQRPMLALFRRFLDQKLKDPQTDAASLAKWRLIQNRLQQPIAETSAIVIDNDGHALILGNWIKDGTPLSLRVIGPDGSESNAKYVGAHPARALAIIKLDSPGMAAPLSFADSAPAPGELLMCLAANSGALGFIASPGQSQKRNNTEQRFAVFGNEEHGPTFIFNTSGQLSALGADRFALPLPFLKNDIQWIIANKKDVAPRQLGVKYAPVTAALRKSARLLANRPAVVVEDVAAGSPADKAGLQKNDIVVTIDRKPIWQMPQIQWDIATETAPVPIGILRDNKEVTLNMPLD